MRFALGSREALLSNNTDVGDVRLPHRCVVGMDDKRWSTYGAERAQPVATGGKLAGPITGSDEFLPEPAVGMARWP